MSYQFQVTTDHEKKRITVNVNDMFAVVMSDEEADRLAFMLNSAIKDLEEEATPKQ